MAYLKMDAKLYRRALEASTHVKVLYNKTAPRFRAGLSERREVLMVYLGDLRVFIQRNTGKTPPENNVIAFPLSDYSLYRTNKADESLKMIYHSLNEDNQDAFKKQYQAVNNLIDEMRGFLVSQKVRGNWNTSGVK